ASSPLTVVEGKEDTGGRRLAKTRQLPALAPPPGGVATAIGAALILAELLARRQDVDVLALLPHIALGDTLAIARAAAVVAEPVDEVGILLDPLGLAVGESQRTDGTSRRQRQHAGPSVHEMPPHADDGKSLSASKQSRSEPVVERDYH